MEFQRPIQTASGSEAVGFALSSPFQVIYRTNNGPGPFETRMMAVNQSKAEPCEPYTSVSVSARMQSPVMQAEQGSRKSQLLSWRISQRLPCRA